MKRPDLPQLRHVAVLVLCALILSAAALSAQKPADKPLSPAFKKVDITKAMRRVADWQLAHPRTHGPREWTQAAYYTGMMAWARHSREAKYQDAMVAMGQGNNWQLGDRKYHADDHAVGQTYLELYQTLKQPQMIQAVKERFDWILEHPATNSLTFGTPNCQERWCWCDALFMSPPVWAKLAATTGDTRYLDFMNREFWAATDFLLDKDEKLYYRDSRYFEQREANGKKIFWSRGNGWVMAGIARILEVLPEDYADRARYVRLFRTLAAQIVKMQGNDGLWRASLLDPVAYPAPETSGTGFFCYALSWGINHRLLDRNTYLPAVRRAWDGLVHAVHPDGKLGWVQPIGADPRSVSADLTEVYGVGAFLLAGTEVHKLAAAR